MNLIGTQNNASSDETYSNQSENHVSGDQQYMKLFPAFNLKNKKLLHLNFHKIFLYNASNLYGKLLVKFNGKLVKTLNLTHTRNQTLKTQLKIDWQFPGVLDFQFNEVGLDANEKMLKSAQLHVNSFQTNVVYKQDLLLENM